MIKRTSLGDQNKHSGFEGKAVRAEFQEQRVYAEAVQTHRYHVWPDVLSAILRRKCV